MMLANLLRAAAPDLAQQVDGVAQLVRQFKEQLDRVEAQQKIILDLMGAEYGRQPDTSASTETPVETRTVD